MDLDLAMLWVAEESEAAGSVEERTQQVREWLLRQMAVGDLALAAPERQRRLAAWLAEWRSLRADPASALYQALLGREVVRTEMGLAVRPAPLAHRRSGAYYTTPAVVDYMVRRAQTFAPDAERLLDPACGAGAFLSRVQEGWGRPIDLVGWDLDPVALQLCQERVPTADLRREDALLTDGESLCDLCLGNPPYISSGLRSAVAHDPARLRTLRERFPQSAQYKVNTYPLFVERGLELLRPGGVLGYILPDSFLTGRYFAGLRRLLLQQTLLELTLIREDFWEHGRVGQSVILFVRKAPPDPGHRVRIRICDRPADLEAGGPSEPGGAADVAQTELAWGGHCRFRLNPDAKVRRLLHALESVAGAQPLGSLLTTYSGLIGKRGQASLLRQPGQRGPWGRLLRSGREIDRYHLAWAGAEVCLDRALIKSGGHLPHYQQPKLLLRQTADRLRAVYDEQGYYCLNNIHVLTPAQPGVNLRALLGLINSGPVNRYYQAVTMEGGRLYAQVDLDILGSLPVPRLSAGEAEAMARLVQRREKAAPDEAAALDGEIDRMVADLYGLGGQVGGRRR